MLSLCVCVFMTTLGALLRHCLSRKCSGSKTKLASELQQQLGPTYTAACCRTSICERGFSGLQPPLKWARFCLIQVRMLWGYIMVGLLPYSNSLCMWSYLLCWSCTVLSKKRISFLLSQWDKRPHCYSVDRGVFPVVYQTWIAACLQSWCVSSCHFKYSSFRHCYEGRSFLMSVSVFNPLAPFNSSSTLSPTPENIKHQAYSQGICVVEHASFKLHLIIVMSATGIWFMKLQFSMASLLSAKWDDDYSVVLGWIRCCQGFCCGLPFIAFEVHWCLHYRALLPIDLVQGVPPISK